MPTIQTQPSPPPPPPPPAVPRSAAGGDKVSPGWSVAEILVGLGGLSLVAAVVVFAAVAWSDLAAWAQGGLLVAATAGLGTATIVCRRRELTATAESLGMVTLALAVADVEVARSALQGIVATRTVWGVGLAVVAAGAIAFGRRAGVRGPIAGGAAIAFVPLPLLAAGFEADTGIAWAFGVQALVAAVVASRRWSGTFERPVLQIGAATSWVVAVAVGLAATAAALVASDAVPVAAVGFLSAIALASLAIGWTDRIPALLVGGALVAFVPALSAAIAVGTPTEVAATLIAQCAFGIGVAASVEPGAGRIGAVLRAALHVGAIVSAAVAASIAVVLAVDAAWFETGGVSTAAVGILVALAAVGVAGSVLAGWRRSSSAVVLAASVGAVLAAAWTSSGMGDDASTTTVVLTTAGALALASAGLARIDDRRPWTAPMAAAAAAVAALAVVPLRAVASIVGAVGEVAVPPVEAGVGTSIRAHLLQAPSISPADLPSTATLGQLGAVALVGLAGAVVGQRWGRWVLTGSAVAAALAAAVVLEIPIGAAAALLAGSLVAVAIRLLRRGDEPVTVVGGAGLSMLLIGVSAASAPLVLAGTALVTALTGAVALRSLVRRAPSASFWVAAALASGLGGLAVDALRLGSVRSEPPLLVAAAAAVVSIAAPAIERWFRDDESGAAAGADLVVGAALVIALLTTRSVDAASGVVAVIGLVAGLHALRPTRRPLVAVALGSSVVLTWMQLVEADISVVEAYTLPLVGALLLAGALVRPERHSSWVRNGAGLTAALVPTASLAIVDGDPTRTVAVVLGGAVAALWGAVARDQAPLAIGGGVLVVLALRHLGPVADEAPRYVSFAVAGVALLATGATFEQRRRDLRRVRDAFGRLG